MGCCLCWFRLDLRLADNPALHHALENDLPVLPIYIHAPEEEAPWPIGGASNWWLHHSLDALAHDLAQYDAPLVIRKGPTLDALQSLIAETGATHVYWNRRYEPAVMERDINIKQVLKDQRIVAESFNGNLLFEPGTIKTKNDTFYQVFTPFWKACLAHQPPPPDPLPKPATFPRAPHVQSLLLDDLDLLPALDWADAFGTHWIPGEAGAQQRLHTFLTNAVNHYDEHRNRPDLMGSSRLSPHLHFGEISPRQIWHAVHQETNQESPSKGTKVFLSEIGWREFSYQILFEHPTAPTEPLRPQFNDFPWDTTERHLEAWQKGQTGYPIVDAGMRELWHTGWMHNRVRMIVASFLVKDLMIPWQRGAAWFWDTLLDADLANNTQGWQWTAGCGVDAAPYFRIFNPITQGKRYDPAGDYVRYWIPEIAKLPTRYIHDPWDAPPEILREANITLGQTYPFPIVDHAEMRHKALNAYKALRKGT